jgi:hypothetical protein
MRDVRRNHEHLTRRQAVAGSADDQLELSEENVHDLLVGMPVLREGRAGVGLHP